MFYELPARGGRQVAGRGVVSPDVGIQQGEVVGGWQLNNRSIPARSAGQRECVDAVSCPVGSGEVI